MKTGIILLTAFVIIGLCNGCSTTIPTTDTTAPVISFSIVGPGVRITINNQTDADRKQINLQQNQEYLITCVVSDRGGVSRNSVRFGIPAANTVFGTFTNQAGDVLTAETAPLTTAFTATGVRSSPLTGLIVKGGFRVTSRPIFFDTHIEARDFGGSTSRFNSQFMTLHMASADRGEVINL